MRTALVAMIASAALLIEGCKSGSGPWLPRFGVSGSVVVHGTLRDAAGVNLGPIPLTNPRGVSIELLGPGGSVTRTATTTSGYRVHGLAKGDYRAVARVAGTVADTTVVFAVIDDDTGAPPLALADSDSLFVYPNPQTLSGSTWFQFAIAANSQVRLELRTLDGSVVKVFFDQLLAAGVHACTWDGTDDLGHPVPAGNYWAVYQSGGAWRAVLVSRQP